MVPVDLRLNRMCSFQCQTDSDKVNYFIELSAGWFACNFPKPVGTLM